MALLGLIGIAMMLPGICFLRFMVPLLLGAGSVSGWAVLWLMTFLLAAGGIALIRYAVRNW